MEEIFERVGVDLYDSDNNFRMLGDILDDLGEAGDMELSINYRTDRYSICENCGKGYESNIGIMSGYIFGFSYCLDCSNEHEEKIDDVINYMTESSVKSSMRELTTAGGALGAGFKKAASKVLINNLDSDNEIPFAQDATELDSKDLDKFMEEMGEEYIERPGDSVE